jgi:IclR family pca regulon transcriptional regulator
MGRVLLAGLDDAQVRQRLQASERPARTRHTVTDPQALLAEVRKARSQGWALVDQELEEGLISMAVAVRDASGRAVAALNVSGHASRHSATQMRRLMLPALQAAALDISQLLQGQVRRGDGR